MKQVFNQKKITLAMLILIFIMPGVLALFFYQHPERLTQFRMNKGHLINRPVKMPLSDAQRNGHWKLAYWHEQDCQAACLKQLDRLARLRLALGRRLYEVDEWLISELSKEQLSADSVRFMQQNEIIPVHVSAPPASLTALLKNQGPVFIISPSGDFVLSYSGLSRTEDIFEDLKHLLSITPSS